MPFDDVTERVICDTTGSKMLCDVPQKLITQLIKQLNTEAGAPTFL